VARKGNAETIDRIRALNLQGIHFQKESKRFYPSGSWLRKYSATSAPMTTASAASSASTTSGCKAKPGKMLISVDARKKWFGPHRERTRTGDNVVPHHRRENSVHREHELEQALKDHASHRRHRDVVENPRTAKFSPSSTAPRSILTSRKKIRNEALKNRASATFMSRLDFQIGDDSPERSKRSSPARKKSFDCQMGSNRDQWHAHSRQQAARPADGRGCLAESSDVGSIKIALRSAKIASTTTSARLVSASRPASNSPGKRADLTSREPLSKVSIGAIFDGSGNRCVADPVAAMVSTFANDGVWKPAHRGGDHAPAEAHPRP